MSEILRRIDNSISLYSAVLMNNTKWRKVLSLIAESSIPVHFAFVREESYLEKTRFPKNAYDENHVKDCLPGYGPFYYKEIYAIKCPIYESKVNTKTGAKYECKQRSEQFLEQLNSIGKLPIKLDEQFIYLKGYE